MKHLIIVITLFTMIFESMAVDFPGTNPGTATAQTNGTVYVLSNQVIAVSFQVSGGQLVVSSIENKIAGNVYTQSVPSPVVKIKTTSAGWLSDWVIASGPTIADAAVDTNSVSNGKHVPGKIIQATLTSVSGGVSLDWSAELRDGSGYIRSIVDFHGDGTTSESFEGIELLCDLEIDPTGAHKVGSQSGPVLRSGGMFFGVEMPFYWNNLSNNRIRAGITTTLSLAPSNSYSFAAVMGVYPEGQLRRAFLHYNNRERARSYKPFLHYNAWFDLERTVSETGMVERINAIHDAMYTQRGVALDSYVIDGGYDDYSAATGGFWKYDENKFPNGFTPVADRLDEVGSHLGIWISPGGGYAAKNERFARGQEALGSTFTAWDLSIPVYYNWWLNRHENHVQNDRSNYFKWDQLGSSLSGHFMRLMQVARILRGMNPDIFINTTVGTWQSPFWLNQIDCTWRGGQDMGFEGDGDERERWNTYRDRVSWDRMNETEHIYPLNALMVHGIVFANGHPFSRQAYTGTKDLRHEARSYFGAGYALQELYLTPSLLGSNQWDALAESAQWAKSKADILVDAHFIGLSPAQNKVYGFAAWQNNKGTITLRNPASVTNSFDLDVGSAFELPAGAVDAYILESPYADQRIQRLSAIAGQARSITLLPFEVLVFDAVQDTQGVYAVLNASEPHGIAPQTILFDVSKSSYTNAIVRYELDANGDGIVDSTNNGISMFTFTNSGTYTAKLTVFDATNYFDVATKNITISSTPPGAEIVAVDSVGSTTVPSNMTSLEQIIDGSGLAEPLSADNRYTVTHLGGLNLENQYLSNNTDGGTFTFYFANKTISEILIWNYSQNDLRGMDAISAVEVDTGSGWVDLGLSFPLQTANAAGNKAQVLDLGEAIAGVNAIRLTVAQGDTGNGETAGGFNEVAFCLGENRGGFSTWAVAHGVPSDDPTANNDSDKFNNFSEYSLGLDPTVNDADGAITFAVTNSELAQFRFLANVSNVNFTVEYSTALQTWLSYNGELILDGSYYQVNIPKSLISSSGCLFLRLRLSE